MIGDLIDKMSQRKIQVDLLKSQSALAISTKGMQDFNANSNAGMMKLLDPSVMSGFKSFGGMFSSPGLPDAGGSWTPPAGYVDVH
jgi:hypothetical protein